MRENTPAYYNDTTDKNKIETTQQQQQYVEKSISSTNKQTSNIDVHETKNVISINKENTFQDIQQVIKRFKINNNPALSLFVAKKYYELKQYNKSYNYALITNEINPNIEASWIIFAKSLVKLKEKKMAITTLEKYIEHSNSNNAKILLNNIKSGKFK